MGLNLMFEVTPKCNNACAFCYNVWKNDPGYTIGQLPLAQIKKLFDRTIPGLPVNIDLSGGEPLLRADLEEIVRYFSAKKIAVSVSTNGTLLSDVRAKSLVKAGVKHFAVTLLAADRDQHNALCKNPQGYDAACAGIVNAKKSGAAVTVSFVALKQNIHYAGQVMDLAFALGADALMFLRFVPTGQGADHRGEFVPSLEQINAALEILDKKSQDYKMKVLMGIPIEPCLVKTELKNIKFSVCQGGLTKFTIDPLGNLRPCEQSPYILGDLHKQNFLAMLVSRQAKRFRRQVKEECRGCKYARICRSGCRFAVKADAVK